MRFFQLLAIVASLFVAGCTTSQNLDNDGFSVADGDCNDSNGDINPAAFEACDGIDNNCDGVIDETCSPDEADADTDSDSDSDADADTDSDADSDTDVDTDTADDTGEPCEELAWYHDADGDGFGNADESSSNCEQPAGYVEDDTDCNDEDEFVYPGAIESCNDVDDDCDGEVDDNAEATWYNDADDDGYGNPEEFVQTDCDGLQPWLVADATDCDDTRFDVNPGATEVCDGAYTDEDCDGFADDDDASMDPSGRFALYFDADSDSYGDPMTSGAYCHSPSEQWIGDDSDCNDADATVNPGAAEVCNEVDDDCDGTVPSDEVDNDGDGYNECADGDCDDASSSIYVGATEACDDIDNDCDGVTDESDAPDATTWYHDADGDGYGDDTTGIALCDAPIDYVSTAGDCDDTTASVNPAAEEVCDDIDNDCDGSVDTDASDATVWSIDNDGDGEGSDTLSDYLVDCDQPDGYVADFSDCNDADAAVNTSATEVADDLVDNDCDGIVDDSGVYCCEDLDGDGYGNGDVCMYEETGVCSDSTYVLRDPAVFDCDDTNASTNPGADDPLSDDGEDYNCDLVD